jgi:hypothetical protein
MSVILKSVAARLTAVSAAAALAMIAVAAIASPAHASSGVDVYVGYADNARAAAKNFPTPWDGSPGVTFEGCTGNCTFDAGAVRIVNNSGSPVRIDSVAIKISSCTFSMWAAASIAPGDQLIVTQTASGASDGCATDGTMDTSDVGPSGERYAGDCIPDHLIPEVDVSIDGTVSAFSDSGQVLNTGGYDLALCPSTTNESTQWTPVGSAPCAGSALTLAPPSQHQDAGTEAKVTATYTNSCGDPLQGTAVDFAVASGPDAGTAGSGVTNASGQATFTYQGSAAGTDTVHASITNPAGSIPSNNVQVIWDQAITAHGGHAFTDTEPAAISATLASFTDPDPSAQGSEYSATIRWGMAVPHPPAPSAGQPAARSPSPAAIPMTTRAATPSQ